MKTYIVEHLENVPNVKHKPIIWVSPIIKAANANEALEVFYQSKFGFTPYDETEVLWVRAAA